MKITINVTENDLKSAVWFMDGHKREELEDIGLSLGQAMTGIGKVKAEFRRIISEK